MEVAFNTSSYCQDRQRLRFGQAENLEAALLDWEWSYYKPMVTELGYRVDREDREASRHTACLLPPANYTE